MTKPPWDNVPDLRRSQHDLCACGHDRAVHTSTEERHRCWSCHILGVDAPAFPDHGFHLILPHHLPDLVDFDAVRYRPDPGWDLPPTRHRAPST